MIESELPAETLRISLLFPRLRKALLKSLLINGNKEGKNLNRFPCRDFENPYVVPLAREAPKLLKN